MATLWFMIVAVMVAAYVLLDGFDLGAGAIHLFIAKTDEERRTILRAIGPVWDGNEVWLLAAGGALYFAFPAALCLQLQRLLSAADDGAVAADAARHRHRVPPPHPGAGVEGLLRHHLRRLPAFCWRSSSARRWATWCAACRSTLTATSSSRCGRTGAWARRTAFSTGTPCICGVVALVTLTVHGCLYLANEDRGRAERSALAR